MSEEELKEIALGMKLIKSQSKANRPHLTKIILDSVTGSTKEDLKISKILKRYDIRTPLQWREEKWKSRAPSLIFVMCGCWWLGVPQKIHQDGVYEARSHVRAEVARELSKIC